MITFINLLNYYSLFLTKKLNIFYKSKDSKRINIHEKHFFNLEHYLQRAGHVTKQHVPRVVDGFHRLRRLGIGAFEENGLRKKLGDPKLTS